MSTWEVVYTEQAENDLRGIYEYIAFTLLEPEIAKKQVKRIIEATAKLNEMPFRYRLYEKEPWYGIEYFYSPEGSDWQNIDYPIMTEDHGLQQNEENEWARRIKVDLSGLPDGQIFLRATVADENVNELSVEQTVIKDVVAENVRSLIAVPNEENNALILSWENPEGFSCGDIYRCIYDSEASEQNWSYVTIIYSSEESSYTDTDVYPYKTYGYKIVTYDNYGNSSADEPVQKRFGGLCFLFS